MKYSPHDYQSFATDFILDHPIAAVFLDMGLGKSIITLTAIFDLCLNSFLVHKVLVIAPLRVARDTWPAEIKKWDHLHGLSFAVAVGSEAERKAALMQRASVYIIFSPSRLFRKFLSVEKPSQSLANDHEGVMRSPISSRTAQSCLNLEMSMPTKYMSFLLFKISTAVSADGLSMYSRKWKRQALTN